jgi:cysteinyl-tRNA synthetase
MTIRLHNTLTDRREELRTGTPGEVRLYVCGPTVYDLSHIGHARCYVAWDVVVRYLRHRGLKVTYVRNFTDVDDKIIRRARERDEDPGALAARYIDEFRHDMALLGVGPADVEPCVTTHMPEILALIERLVASGNAYESRGDVYFAVRSFSAYGKLSKRHLDELKAGARVEPGEQKRDPLDFALWKAAKPGEPSWDSPWGNGRPGWHIECSAMSAKYLGDSFDIHAGGKDLVFPHHENEIAQSEAATGVPLATHWMHNGFVTIDDEKMSKSLGNFFTIRDLLERYEPRALRLLLLGTHYRAPISFSEVALRDAERRAEYIYETLAKVDARLAGADVDEGPFLDEARVAALLGGFHAAMDDDFNTADAIGQLSTYLGWMNELVDKPPAGANKAAARRTLARIRSDFGQIASILGVGDEPARVVLDRMRALHARRRHIDCTAVEALIVARSEARRAKDFARADAIRGEAAALGVEIMDTPAGTTWRVLPAHEE